MPTNVLESYVGKYTASDDEYGIVLEGQELFMEMGGQKYKLYAISSDRFKLTNAAVYVIFRFDDAGSVSGITIDQGGETTEATRIN